MKCKSRHFHPVEGVLWSLIALLGAARVHLLFVRVYDPDEFEHLHAGFCVAQGLVPYRDFFEHHGPLTYWLSAGIVSFLGPGIELLTAHRLASFALAILTALGTWLLAKQIYGRRVGAWALLGMLTFPIFVEKSVEWRPDALATPLVVWGAFLIVTPSRHPFFASLMAGSLMGIALLTTQKTLFLVAGLLVAAIFTWHLRSERTIPKTLGLLLGGGLAGATVLGVLYQQQAIGDAYVCLWERPLSWPTKTRGPDVLLEGLHGHRGIKPLRSSRSRFLRPRPFPQRCVVCGNEKKRVGGLSPIEPPHPHTSPSQERCCLVRADDPSR